MKMVECQPTQTLLDHVVIESVPSIHEDSRRAVVQFHNSDVTAFRNSVLMTISHPEKEGIIVAGEHFEDEVEEFFILSGTIAYLILEDITTKARVIYRDLPQHTKIVLPPKVAHTFVFCEVVQMIAMRENPFSEEQFVPYPLFAGSLEL
jgi:cupin superfamily acireductone dioxygenase involved in methionine salvage